MRLTAIRHYIPRRIVSRDETLDLFRHYSRDYYQTDAALDDVLHVINKLLVHSQFRQCTVRGEGEPFYVNLLHITRRMVAELGIPPNEIGTVIYCGIGRGYMEPATACRMAAHLGLQKAEFFDVLDACNGWSRTARVAESLLRNEVSRHILVLSLEFGRSPLL